MGEKWVWGMAVEGKVNWSEAVGAGGSWWLKTGALKVTGASYNDLLDATFRENIKETT